MEKTDYAIETRLKELSPDLYRRYRDCFVVSGKMLLRYENYFPDFTDHSLLHTMDILEFAGTLIGDQINSLTAEDLYVLAMGALFHDIGMGVSFSDFDEFMKELGLPIEKNAEERPWAVRRNHQELSGLFLKKYSSIFDIPNEKYLHAIVQVCRGHRKTDLLNEKEYPVLFAVEEGKSVYLAYLAALICLADELDISEERNISFLYDVESMPEERDRVEFHKHMAVNSVEIEEDAVIVRAESSDKEIENGVREVCSKLNDKLVYCRSVAEERSPFRIKPKEVILYFGDKEKQ